jgi:hypothetical protein
MPKHPSHKLIKGLGAAALLTAAAAGYYFVGPRGKKHQAKATAWVKTAKKDLTVRLEKMQAVTEDGYQKAVSDVLNKYRQIKNIQPAELADFGEELKRHWFEIEKKVKNLGTPKKLAKKTIHRK